MIVKDDKPVFLARQVATTKHQGSRCDGERKRLLGNYN